MRRIAKTTITAVMVAALMAVILPTQALAADSSAEAQFVSLLNAERTSRGLPALKVASDLVRVAREHSADMGAQDRLHHNPNLGSDVSNWQKVGENVGRGPGVELIHDAFMGSSGHRANILDSDWTQVGVGVVVVDGQVWVTQIFRLPMNSTSEPAPEPKPEPAPEPEPEPAPEPEPEPEPAPAPAPAPTPAPTPESAPSPANAPEPAQEPTVPALADVMLEMIG